MLDLRARTMLNASFRFNESLYMRQATVMVTERDTPARQCTSTPFSLLRASSVGKCISQKQLDHLSKYNTTYYIICLTAERVLDAKYFCLIPQMLCIIRPIHAKGPTLIFFMSTTAAFNYGFRWKISHFRQFPTVIFPKHKCIHCFTYINICLLQGIMEPKCSSQLQQNPAKSLIFTLVQPTTVKPISLKSISILYTLMLLSLKYLHRNFVYMCSFPHKCYIFSPF